MRPTRRAPASDKDAVDKYLAANFREADYHKHPFKGEPGLNAIAAQKELLDWCAGYKFGEGLLFTLRNQDNPDAKRETELSLKGLFDQMVKDLDWRFEAQLSKVRKHKQENFQLQVTEGYIFANLTQLFSQMSKQYGEDVAKVFLESATLALKTYMEQKKASLQSAPVEEVVLTQSSLPSSPVDETEQAKKSLRIDPAFFELKIQGICVLTDQNAGDVRKAIGKIARDMRFEPAWNFLQDLQKLNLGEFTKEQFEELYNKYIKNDDINIGGQLKKKVEAELAETNPNLFVFKEIATNVFQEFFVMNSHIQNAVATELKARRIPETMDTEKAMTNYFSDINLRDINTNKKLMAAPIAEMQLRISELKSYYQNRIQIIKDQVQSHPGNPKMHPEGDMIMMTRELRDLQEKLRRVSTLGEDVQRHREMLDNLKKQKEEIRNNLVEDAAAKFGPLKDKGAIDLKGVKSLKEDLEDYVGTHSGKTDTLNGEKTRIANAANTEIAKLQHVLAGGTDAEKFMALVNFKSTITKLIDENRQAVDVHNANASILKGRFKASYGDLEKHLTGLIDNKSKLGPVLNAATSTHDRVDFECMKKITELENRAPAKPAAVGSPAPVVEEVHVLQRARR